MQRLLFGLSLVLLLCNCRGDRGDRLFEMNYPPITFTLPAGLVWPQSWVVARSPISSQYQNYLSENSLTTDQVSAVGGAFARLTALDGNDFRALQSVSVRVCPPGTEPCTEADEVFFLGDLFGRRQQVLNLNPGLRNIKPLIEAGQYKIELILTPAQSTPAAIECRFEWSFEAVE